LYLAELRDPQEEARLLAEVARAVAELVVGGNPVPVWLWLVIAGLIVGGGGLALWQFYQASQPIVVGIQQWAPLMAGAFTILLYTLSFIPFFFIFNTVITLLAG